MAASGKKKTKTPAKRKKPLNEKHVTGFFFIISLALTVFLGTLLLALHQLKIPDIRSVAHYQPPQTSLIYDRHGEIVDRIFKENRVVVSLNKMHPLVPKAFVAAEDSRFFEHPGVDFFSLLRAFINNIRHGRKGQGGSTITQQVAKGLLLSPEKTYLRKFKEAILAWRIDTLLSKEEIIYIYLNQIYLGEGAYGVEAAAQTYFNKRASRLSLGEVALLAGLPQAPSRYSPMDHWEQAHARQRYVLNRMAADGYITAAQARGAYTKRPSFASSARSFRPANGYYLQVVRWRAEHMLGISLETAGMRIYTNLDQGMQRNGVQAIRSGTKEVFSRQDHQGGKGRSSPQGALVCLDGCSGKIRALVGGTDFIKTPFNRAVQAKRPAGSVFKPLVYSAALENGWTSQSVVVDEPISIRGADGRPWKPKNFSGRYYGSTTLETAFIHSYNIPAIKVMQRIGIKPVHEMARRFGITADLPPDLSLALGAADISLLEMSGSYLPFTCKGSYIQPTLIHRITNSSGKELYRHRQRPLHVLKKTAAREMKKMLIQAVASGTGQKARGIPGISGGKTGTSDDSRDAWFIGFHDQLITGVWIGHDKNQSLGKNENGGRTAAPIWRSFMGTVYH